MPLFPSTVFEAFPALDIILGDGNFVSGRGLGGNNDGDDADEGERGVVDVVDDPFVTEREGEDSVGLNQLMVGGRFDLRDGARDDDGDDDGEV